MDDDTIEFERSVFEPVPQIRTIWRSISEDCTCPGVTGIDDGGTLSDTYCVSSDFTGISFSLCYTCSCNWCGLSGTAEEDHKAVLAIVAPGIDGSACQWVLTFDDGISSFYKSWEDGDPVGDYVTADGDPGGSVSECSDECVSTSDFWHCDECCPPMDAPTSIEVAFTYSGTSGGCCEVSHDRDVDFSVSADNVVSPLDWESSVDGCCTTAFAVGTVMYDCGEDCITFPPPEITWRVDCNLCFIDGSWNLICVASEDGGGSTICASEGLLGFFIDGPGDLGADPTGTHHLDGTGTTFGDWTLDVTIS